ncbi:MAG: excinuclease ABC subunit UvrB [bacterium]
MKRSLIKQKFNLKAPFKSAGDQPQAIKQLVSGLNKGFTRQTLLGTTGSGKTATMSWVIAKTQKPTLVISHNKTLAAQLAEEFRQFFPDNAVEYFVSYYDYYQPEAYLPRSDTYIAKDASINDEIDRLRHASLEAVLTRSDVIVVTSVSCIYGLGLPSNYFDLRLVIRLGDKQTRNDILRQLVRLQYNRNDTDLIRGTYRVRGDTLDIHPAGEDAILRLEFFGSKVDRLSYRDDLTGQVFSTPEVASIFPATFFISSPDSLQRALSNIRLELAGRTRQLTKQNKLVEAERLQQRTNYDLEMIEQIGYCSGIENYSRHIDGRAPGAPPATLLDYFVHSYNKNFLVFIDESHMTIPQISAMSGGDAARKDNLINYGFRLPSARDNRPLKFHEFEDRISQTIFVSATPADYERNISQQVAEQIVRPTGLLDPTIDVRPLNHQVDDVINEIQQRAKKKQRILVTTLTKRMAEELSTYLIEMGIKAAYLHSDIDTFERLEILRNLRLGTYDVLVGINLLREGLDLPEVSLVAVMDADKEGFLRSTTSLVQVMGRAARHSEGHVIMYADTVTASMREAIDETSRRRAIQQQYNKQHKIIPRSIKKSIQESSLTRSSKDDHEEIDPEDIPPDELVRAVKELTAKMDLAARNLEFEKAAQLRDMIQQILNR